MHHVYNCTGHELKLPEIVRSETESVFDRDGKRYLDLESGVWCTSIGHNNPRVRDAAFQQWDALMHGGFAYSNPVVESAAAKLLDVVKWGEGRCVFLCSGSEAIEISRQMARHLTGFTKSLTFRDSYLGAYTSVTDRRDGWHVIDWLDPNANEDELVASIPADVSDFVFEPGSSSGYVRFPPPSLVERVALRVRENGGKIIANEVTTGTGRTGKWFGYQHYQLTPDLIAVGKGIGNGYPVSVAMMSPETASELEGSSFHYSQSHQNDPLGASIVCAVVDVIEDGKLITRAAEDGEAFLKRLGAIVDNHTVTAVRGRGLMIAIDLRDSPTTEAVYEHLLHRGYIVGNRGSFLRVDPPLTTPLPELFRFVDVLDDVIARVK
jgi:acetylornithine aminotransferase